MIEVLGSDAMRSIDRRTIDEIGVPSIVLMENAGSAVAETILDHFSRLESALVLCGRGNNGGDGYVVARHLVADGVDVTLVSAADPSALKGDGATNADICRALGLPIGRYESPERLLELIEEVDVVVDALLGTGLDRPAEGVTLEIIETLNDSGVPVVAVDVPSGLDASSPIAPGPHVRADLTVTFCRPKVCTVLDPAATACGEVVVADISIPEAAVEAEGAELLVMTPFEAATTLPERDSDWHKGDSGRIAIWAGSAGRSGAALLATRGAVRAGGGLVTLISDEATNAIVDAQSAESMSVAIRNSADEVLEQIAAGDVAVVGPGLADDQHRLIQDVLRELEGTVVVDATALNAIADETGFMKDLAAKTVVLTPHPGEMSRLLGTSVESVQNRRVESARELATAEGAIVVLKGHQSIVAEPGGKAVVNLTGNPSMASGGMGDVLSGVIAAWLAQAERTDPFEVVAAAVWMHGFAGDLVAERSGPGMTALDLAEMLPFALRRARELP